MIQPTHNNKRILLHLSLVQGVTSATIFKVLMGLFHEHFPDRGHASWTEIVELMQSLDLRRVYDYSVHDFMHQCGATELSAKRLHEGLREDFLVDDELDLAYKHAVAIVSLFDNEYPALLKSIHAPPPILYTKGASLQSCDNGIGVVGSRKATVYAHNVIKGLVPPLIEHGWEIISGGAEGADTMAHQVALDYGGVTRAVLGSGLLKVYPLSNKKLFESITASNGTVVSPFSLTTGPEKGNFPARNRIIAGLSKGSLVVQAAAKSGALITAHHALEQGRVVFAVPGLISDELSAGCHALIKQGAKLVNSASDILEEFGEVNVAVEAVKKKSSCLPAVDPFLKYLETPVTLDELLEKTGLEVGDVQQRLFTFTLEGKIKQNFIGTWERV